MENAEIYFSTEPKKKIEGWAWIEWDELDPDEVAMVKKDCDRVKFTERDDYLIHLPPAGHASAFPIKTKLKQNK